MGGWSGINEALLKGGRGEWAMGGEGNREFEEALFGRRPGRFFAF